MGGGYPRWLVKRLPAHPGAEVPGILEGLGINTVCREARCPNRAECWSSGTAAFLIMGSVCTRNCRFCAVHKGAPQALDLREPSRIAQAAEKMKLNYAVVTSVTRDDLADGGAGHFAATVEALHSIAGAAVEVLVPDFLGRLPSVDTVLAARPEVFNHNVETVPRLYEEVRPMASYSRSLEVLAHAAGSGVPAKSGLMAGLGETEAEVEEVLSDLRAAGVESVTIGQYLAPGKSAVPVKEYVTPERFEKYRESAVRLGFTSVASAPFVRSSYHAAVLAGYG
ncbi:MAG TPA: lipoyl synthase [Planctomycetes bacterium]|nr:lipoyl synthase [Planctomycetota bacterium]